ncbi:P-loop containing nucleoside triphosphate hydrolase protein [Gymnopus androsaceus JB14]|uniref:P-loop containing nucleoside triphosphate hydrolase protein n=1 Tax=Gymnopus androsaceus JB14 TaxID=1447944 RepID=A0A6A4GPZ3_9AGAR|nr:P-loop containing nucleoside triphosphate hydrolase protein [Gymnopus androsaceus JB14]
MTSWERIPHLDLSTRTSLDPAAASIHNSSLRIMQDYAGRRSLSQKVVIVIPGPTDCLKILCICVKNTKLANDVDLEQIAVDTHGYIGSNKVKQELQETMQYPVDHPGKFLKYSMSPSKGVSFYGPPGTGKMLLAKAIAHECNQGNESEANVRDVFKKTCATVPHVMFFDELDSIAKAHGGSSGNAGGTGNHVLNQILTKMDQPRTPYAQDGSIMHAICSRWMIDSVLLHPGHLDQLIYIPLPDKPSYLSILKATLKKSPIATNVNLDGFSGANLTEIF